MYRSHLIVAGVGSYFSAKYGEVEGSNFREVQGRLNLIACHHDVEFMGVLGRRDA